MDAAKKARRDHLGGWKGEAMTTTNEAPNKASTLKDLVVTAAVATVVSALVSPWVRRWTEPEAPTGPPQPPPQDEPPEDLSAHLERLLDVPDPFATTRESARRQRDLRTSTRRPTDDDDDDDLDP
jgi:hypothetical protein